MHRMRYACLTLGLLAGIVLGSRSSVAQYTTDYQTNIIRGVTNNWTGDYLVGSNTFANALVIETAGVLSNSFGYLGYEASSSNNSVIVSGNGSVWGNSGSLVVGKSGANNRLVICDGGTVIDSRGRIGNSSSNNSVLVTDAGSVWSNSLDLAVNVFGSRNSLVVSNGGQVFNRNASFDLATGAAGGNYALIVGFGSAWNNSGTLIVGGSLGGANTMIIMDGGRVNDNVGWIGSFQGSNSVIVLGAGSVWNNRGDLRVGSGGPANSVIVSNGGIVLATNLVVGFSSATCDNLLQLDSGNVIVTNASTNATLEVRSGKLVLNGGTLLVDRFVMTNSCAQFVRTGGTLIYGTAVLDPNRDDDGDGIPNGWEQLHGLDSLNAADASMDKDGDGFTNLQEYMAGTDPNDNGSALRITSILQIDSNVLVSWTMGSGKTNALQWTEGISGSYATNNFATMFIVTNTVGSTTNYLDEGVATNAPARYYRVRLVP